MSIRPSRLRQHQHFPYPGWWTESSPSTPSFPLRLSTSVAPPSPFPLSSCGLFPDGRLAYTAYSVPNNSVSSCLDWTSPRPLPLAPFPVQRPAVPYLCTSVYSTTPLVVTPCVWNAALDIPWSVFFPPPLCLPPPFPTPSLPAVSHFRPPPPTPSVSSVISSLRPPRHHSPSPPPPPPLLRPFASLLRSPGLPSPSALPLAAR